MTLILASTSPYRRRLLERLRLPFECEPPGVEESPVAGESPRQLAARLARAKAAAVAGHRPEATIIGSDQVASIDGALLGKPGHFDAAFSQLRRCSGRCVEFTTGLCLLGPGDLALDTIVSTRVYFRELGEDRLKRYLELDQPYDCAGSFKWESLGICLFERLDSEDPTALEGLPLIALSGMLLQAGLDPLGS